MAENTTVIVTTEIGPGLIANKELEPQLKKIKLVEVIETFHYLMFILFYYVLKVRTVPVIAPTVNEYTMDISASIQKLFTLSSPFICRILIHHLTIAQ